MSALACKRMMAESIPVKPSHPEPGLRRNYRPIPFRILRPGTQCDEILRLQSIDAVCVRFKIVKQSDRVQFQQACQVLCIDRPWQIRNLAATRTHGSSHTEARAVHRNPLTPDELRQYLGQPTMVLAQVGLL